MDAFASVISNNLNMVLKQLTIVTIILMIPTLVASFFGMNVKLPFGTGQETPVAFIGVLVISVVLSIAGVMLLRRRKWL